jgi:hypothetical protein
LTAWKARALTKLVELTEKYKDNENLRTKLEQLMKRISDAKTRDLPTIIVNMYFTAKDVPELKEIIPTEDELKGILEQADMKTQEVQGPKYVAAEESTTENTTEGTTAEGVKQ